MKTDSKEFKDLMNKWSDEAWKEEVNSEYEEYIEHKDNYNE